MNQTHSNNVKIIEKEGDNIKVNADAIVTTKDNLALGVLTADCAPILFFETKKKIIGCIHAGWKGAINGIIENTIEKIKELGGEINKVRVCIGPCIDKKNYEVKKDFYQNFKQKSENSDIFFSKGRDDSLYFDLRGYKTSRKFTTCPKHVWTYGITVLKRSNPVSSGLFYTKIHSGFIFDAS